MLCENCTNWNWVNPCHISVGHSFSVTQTDWIFQPNSVVSQLNMQFKLNLTEFQLYSFFTRSLMVHMMISSCWMLGPMRCQLLVRSWISQWWYQVLIGSWTSCAGPDSCWMLGPVWCHWFLLDLWYIACHRKNHVGETLLKPGLSPKNRAPMSHGSILDALDPMSTTIQSLSPTHGLIDINNPQSGSLMSLPPLLQSISPSPL